MKRFLFTSLVTLTIISLTNGKIESATPIEFTEKEILEILDVKCNSCHRIHNPRKVFTEENMNENAKSIYRQVFRWKRMPKGDKIKLTETDKNKLNNWINSLNK